MLDFHNKTIFKLKEEKGCSFLDIITPILVENEQIVVSYKSMRDGVVFTSMRVLAINVQGLTGSKKDISSLPYSKIQAFSVETAGTLDLDAEIELWFSGLGKVRFEFSASSNVKQLCQLISTYTLK
jgi:hypothetical protein